MQGNKVLLTSDYNMYRASNCFRHEGLDVVPRPFPDVLKRERWLKFRWQGFLMVSDEWVKIGYYKFRGWI